MANTFKIWWLASRPKTLGAAIAPVLIGTALAIANDKIHVLAAVAALMGAIFIQIGTNFANDYFDFLKGADNAERVGPLRATQAGLVTPETMRSAFLLIFMLALIPGFYLIWRGGWPILVVGILSIASGILYTGGPAPLGYLGLGDIFVFIFFGLVAVTGTYYVQTLAFSWIALIAGIAPGFLATALLTVNNLRDVHTDRIAGKRTLAVRWGILFARLEYLFCIGGAFFIPLLLCGITHSHYYSLFSLLGIVPAISLLKMVFQNPPGTVLNQALAGTGKVLVLYSVLFAIGWIL